MEKIFPGQNFELGESGEPVRVEFVETKKAKMIKASRILQAKIGLGPLDPRSLRRCEELMINANINFGPLAHEYLTKLEDTIQRCKAGSLRDEQAVNALTEPVMQLKAHAAMFRYPLIGHLANIMLGFLESIEQIDSGVADIIEAHHRSLQTIVTKQMEGEGGTYGKRLQAELKEACRRYFAKRKS